MCLKLISPSPQVVLDIRFMVIKLLEFPLGPCDLFLIFWEREWIVQNSFFMEPIYCK